MEKKKFRFIKNILFPVKTEIELGPDGVTYKGAFVDWKNIESCTYSITSINRAMNYVIHYTDTTGKTYMLNMVVAVTGKKAKKEMFAEIYLMFHQGLSEHVILPKAKKMVDDINRGLEVTVAKSTITKNEITVPKVMKRKEKVTIPMDKVLLTHRDGSGGFDVQSSDNKKERGFFQYAMPETRELLATLEMMLPEQAEVYK